MGFLSLIFGKSNSKVDIDPLKVYQSIADSIVDSACSAGYQYNEFGTNKAIDVSIEFCFVLLNFVDVSIFSVLRSDRRDAAFDNIALLTIQSWSNKISKSSPDVNISEYKSAMLSTMNRRNFSYGLCKGEFSQIAFGLSFYINKALGFTNRDDIDSIISDYSKLTDNDMKDFPQSELCVAIGKQLSEALAEVNAIRKLEALK